MRKRLQRLVAVLLTLVLCVGCGSEPQEQEAEEIEIVPTIFSDITGIPQDNTVMTVGETEVPAELYFYWYCYVCSTLEYNILSDYSNYGMYSNCVDSETMSIDWTAEYADIPLLEYAKSQVETTIKYYVSIEELAAEKGVTLSEANREALDADFQNAVAEMGSEEAVLNYIEMLGLSRENFDRVSAYAYLYTDLVDQVFTEGSDLYLSEEDYNNYAYYADHILLATQDMQTGEVLTPNESMEKYELAEDLLEQLRAAEDPVALFDQLADEYSEDPSREDYPAGYIYTSGQMVPEFEGAVVQLEPGEISDIVQSDYGFHIILRRDLLAALEEDESQKAIIAQEYVNQLLAEKGSKSEVTYDECLDDVDWDAFYPEYTVQVSEMSEEFEASANTEG